MVAHLLVPVRDQKDFDRDWHSFKPDRANGITVGTLIGRARDAGFDLGGFLAQLGMAGMAPGAGVGVGASGSGSTSSRGDNATGAGGHGGNGASVGTADASAQGATANPSGETGWAPPLPLPITLLPVPSFNPAWLPDLVRPLCLDIASSLPCAIDYPAVNLFTCLGSVLGNKLLVEAKTVNSWTEVANLWGLCIGDVSQMKSPSAYPFLQLMNRLQERAQQQHSTAVAQHQGAMMAHQALLKHHQKSLNAAAAKGATTASPSIPLSPPEPLLKHYFTTNATYEKLGELCVGNRDGVLVYGDEVSGLLASLNREEMRAARAFFLTGFNGKSPYKFDRIMRGTVALPRYALGILGNIQPDPLLRLLVEHMKLQNDGMTQRFGLMVWPDPVALGFVDQPRPPYAFHNACKVFDAFAELDPQKTGASSNFGNWEWFIRLDQAAQARFVNWLTTENLRVRQNTSEAASLREHFGKYPKLVLALALMLHLMDLVQATSNAALDEPQGEIAKLFPITLNAVVRAIEIASYAAGHARRVYRAGADPAYVTARLLALRIAKGELAGTVRVRHIVRHCWSDLTDVDRVAAGLAVLEDYGWVREHQVRRGATGRPASNNWDINPLGWGAQV